MKTIVRGFTHVLRFAGRDGPGQFWPFAGVVLALVFLGWGGVMTLEMNRVFAELARFAAAHPDQATVVQTPTSYSVAIEPGADIDFAPDIRLLFGGMAGLVGTTILLLAAAVTRRLHDRGLPGFFGLAPVPFLTFGLYGMARLMADFGTTEGIPPMFYAVFLNNMIYLAVLLGLVIVLSLPGQKRENRYGPAPT